MIGKSANPFYFRTVKTKPVQYTNNKKAWMTGEIFRNWLIDLDKLFQKKRRTILLFIDNCTAHQVPNLNNVKVIFFPPNMTSHVQPMDMSIYYFFTHFDALFVLINCIFFRYH